MIKILLVEDSKFLRMATERALTRAGYEMSSAIDGEEALRLAREKMPDLILLDMLLPKMSRSRSRRSRFCRGCSRSIERSRSNAWWSPFLTRV